ncbi:unnamed protein product [Rhizophagus irregularis]|nr:unnamed protein product [Rhizophagus irregularis]
MKGPKNPPKGKNQKGKSKEKVKGWKKPASQTSRGSQKKGSKPSHPQKKKLDGKDYDNLNLIISTMLMDIDVLLTIQDDKSKITHYGFT